MFDHHLPSPLWVTFSKCHQQSLMVVKTLLAVFRAGLCIGIHFLMNNDPCQQTEDKLLKKKPRRDSDRHLPSPDGSLIPQCAVLDHYPRILGEKSGQLVILAIAGLLRLYALRHSLLVQVPRVCVQHRYPPGTRFLKKIIPQ